MEVGKEGGGPIVEGGWIVFIDVVVDISGELIGDGSLGAGAEQLGFGLEIMEAGLEFGGRFREGGDDFSEVVVCVGRGAKGVAEEADAGGDFSRRIPGVLIDVVKGSLEAVLVPRREEGEW